jgi:putative restriction endonuclease
MALTLLLPQGASGTLSVADIPTLHWLVRRAFQLLKTLPDQLLLAFEEKTATLPRTTEAERLVVQRVGQDVFRAGLLDYWDGQCAISGLAVVELLRASHIKPWPACDSDAERLSVFNGLLLAPNLDAVFDRGLITVMEDGVVVSPQLGEVDRRLLGLDVSLVCSVSRTRTSRSCDSIASMCSGRLWMERSSPYSFKRRFWRRSGFHD